MVPWGVQKPWLKQHHQHQPHQQQQQQQYQQHYINSKFNQYQQFQQQQQHFQQRYSGGAGFAAAGWHQPQRRPPPAIPSGFQVDPNARYIGTVSGYNKWRGFGCEAATWEVPPTRTERSMPLDLVKVEEGKEPAAASAASELEPEAAGAASEPQQPSPVPVERTRPGEQLDLEEPPEEEAPDWEAPEEKLPAEAGPKRGTRAGQKVQQAAQSKAAAQARRDSEAAYWIRQGQRSAAYADRPSTASASASARPQASAAPAVPRAQAKPTVAAPRHQGVAARGRPVSSAPQLLAKEQRELREQDRSRSGGASSDGQWTAVPSRRRGPSQRGEPSLSRAQRRDEAASVRRQSRSDYAERSDADYRDRRVPGQRFRDYDTGVAPDADFRDWRPRGQFVRTPGLTTPARAGEARLGNLAGASRPERKAPEEPDTILPGTHWVPVGSSARFEPEEREPARAIPSPRAPPLHGAAASGISGGSSTRRRSKSVTWRDQPTADPSARKVPKPRAPSPPSSAREELPYLEAQAASAAAKVVAARAKAAAQSEAPRGEERARLAIDSAAELARASYQRQQAQEPKAQPAPAKAVPKAQPVPAFETPGAAFNLLGKGGPPPRRPFLPDCSGIVEIPEPEPDLGQGKGKRAYSEVLQAPASASSTSCSSSASSADRARQPAAFESSPSVAVESTLPPVKVNGTQRDLERAKRLVVEVSGSSRPWAAVRRAEMQILRRLGFRACTPTARELLDRVLSDTVKQEQPTPAARGSLHDLSVWDSESRTRCSDLSRFLLELGLVHDPEAVYGSGRPPLAAALAALLLTLQSLGAPKQFAEALAEPLRLVDATGTAVAELAEAMRLRWITEERRSSSGASSGSAVMEKWVRRVVSFGASPPSPAELRQLVAFAFNSGSLVLSSEGQKASMPSKGLACSPPVAAAARRASIGGHVPGTNEVLAALPTPARRASVGGALVSTEAAGRQAPPADSTATSAAAASGPG
ncbi:unnamed protein product, partial [Polarella glacialis]